MSGKGSAGEKKVLYTAVKCECCMNMNSIIIFKGSEPDPKTYF
jgi:hypothetical protein